MWHSLIQICLVPILTVFVLLDRLFQMSSSGVGVGSPEVSLAGMLMSSLRSENKVGTPLPIKHEMLADTNSRIRCNSG